MNTKDNYGKVMMRRMEYNAISSNRHSLQVVTLSQQLWQTAVQIVSKPMPPAMGPDLPYFFWVSRLSGLVGWLIKAGDVETNPGPITHKQFRICDICHKQIHGRKQISIRCNRIEHLVHLICAGIRPAQYTDTWTCHLYKESNLTQT